MSLFNPDSLTNRLPVIVWWLAVQLIALISLPIGFVVFGNLRDKGYGIIKTLGLLLVAYLPWLARQLQDAAPLAASASCSASSSWPRCRLSSSIAGSERSSPGCAQHRWLILSTEVVFTVAFLAFVVIRMLNPDLWQPWNGGEKPMEFGFLSAISRSTYFPPYDPFFAGGYINYYYYGYYICAMLVRLTGIMPSVAFNLIIPLLFALTITNAFSITYNLVAGLRKHVDDVDAATSLRSLPELSRLASGVGAGGRALRRGHRQPLDGRRDLQGAVEQGPDHRQEQPAGRHHRAQGHRRGSPRPAARSACVRRLQLLESQPCHPGDDQRVPVLELPVCRPASRTPSAYRLPCLSWAWR